MSTATAAPAQPPCTMNGGGARRRARAPRLAAIDASCCLRASHRASGFRRRESSFPLLSMTRMATARLPHRILVSCERDAVRRGYGGAGLSASEPLRRARAAAFHRPDRHNAVCNARPSAPAPAAAPPPPAPCQLLRAEDAEEHNGQEVEAIGSSSFGDPLTRRAAHAQRRLAAGALSRGWGRRRTAPRRRARAVLCYCARSSQASAHNK